MWKGTLWCRCQGELVIQVSKRKIKDFLEFRSHDSSTVEVSTSSPASLIVLDRGLVFVRVCKLADFSREPNTVVGEERNMLLRLNQFTHTGVRHSNSHMGGLFKVSELGDMVNKIEITQPSKIYINRLENYDFNVYADPEFVAQNPVPSKYCMKCYGLKVEGHRAIGVRFNVDEEGGNFLVYTDEIYCELQGVRLMPSKKEEEHRRLFLQCSSVVRKLQNKNLQTTIPRAFSFSQVPGSRNSPAVNPESKRNMRQIKEAAVVTAVLGDIHLINFSGKASLFLLKHVHGITLYDD